MSIDLNQTAIDPSDPLLQPFLDDLQGKILKSDGRDFGAYVFLQFKGDVAAVKRWISEFAHQSVTSAAKQDAQRDAFKAMLKSNSPNPIATGTFGGFYLSASGYAFLGITNLPEDPQHIFRRGMKARQPDLADPPVSLWQTGFQKTIHAMINLADSDQAVLEQELAGLQQKVQALGIADVLTVERGARLKRVDPQGDTYDIEPFGYADGVSQPLFYKTDIAHSIGGSDRWDSSAPLSLALVADPNGVSPDSCGSFLVFRKLQQDVENFQADVAALAGALGATEDLAGAYAVGRFKNGTPVVTQTVEDPSFNARDNNFNYAQDLSGGRCPFQAHIRKVNPRGQTPLPFPEERQHRIVRRAVPYRETSNGKVAQGLQFVCFMSSILYQFEAMQRLWANSIGFIEQGAGLDALIGQGTQLVGGQSWPQEYGKPESGTIPFDFSHRVALQGGEYLFAPSIGFLKHLS